MDPVLTAKQLIDSLLREESEELETKKKNEEETEEEEEEGDDEEEMDESFNEDSEDSEDSDSEDSGSNGSVVNTVQKIFVHDAHGGTVSDAHGGTEILGTAQYMDTHLRNLASVASKPSFATQLSETQIKRDIQTIFGSKELSEEFMNKAGSLYEAAVLTKANEVIKEIHEQYEAAFVQEVADVKQELTEKVDSYLNYVVEEWLNENKLAIEAGIRTEIAENFIGKLKNLFVESYIEVPQNKTNLFDEMVETISSLENRVNEEVRKNVTLVNENRARRAVGIFLEQTKNLTDVQVDKLSKLAENIQFESEEDFADKIKTLVENVTRVPVVAKPKTSAPNLMEETIIESEDEGSEQEVSDPYIKLYSDILSRTVQK